ncbi:DNA-binding response regulator [Agrococcus sp. SGAir0287]|nr:DNA-binding response regulator [Agrococcus sp. SGAir0287]
MRVVVVDDQTLVRQGIRTLLALVPGVEVVGEAADGAEGAALVAEAAPDVVLLDLRMPRVDGIGMLEALRAAGDGTPCLVLTTFDDDDLLVRALRAGARGYLLKDVSLETLEAAIRALAAGGTYLHPAVTETLLRATAPEQDAARVRAAQLTPREREVLRLMAAGLTNREIAASLVLAEGTVKNHVSAVLAKLGTADRTNAVLRALRERLIDAG